MQYALTAPVLKSIALAGLALGVGAAASSLSPEPTTHRLRLHAADTPGDIYITAFHRGDIRVTFDGDALQPIQLRTRARLHDGCRWLGIETLIPRDERSFDYDYTDRMLGCAPGATPMYIPTSRKGIVTVED